MVCLNQVKLTEFHKFTSEQRLEMLIRACIASPSKVKAVDVSGILTNSLLPFIATYEKGTLEPRVKQCFLRVAEFCSVGFEAITILAKQWQAGNVALVTALEGLFQVSHWNLFPLSLTYISLLWLKVDTFKILFTWMPSSGFFIY